ncbi:tRNA adenosine(34) deaminase TadA [Tissierella praeacuta]|uniref:tRNA-specific adenosine deaminase n=1 Tax=Tissierella praeacuta DSM 18095 TaxID=1123404 RepID=A0A1M4Y2A3_9FIRM|nr:tRNA adenosine(34) deaminase TadA [Tissierella praeacuta]HAE92102.1 tRNA adenosine(34) deaminase TadA [Tissierella sp.]MBU5256465.1 tRNA adenosine(34) deaminase TadA [Tissierella praeacuta]TCU79480.1 tRNA(adenine34) deaminase [Tissierella praeacuta]SHE99964.1 tRNA(adenine34) deaminase [Tissierella praeacuta DSM 18095]SUO98889.1 tRNA-specific adenosine deaminase [Tissierella praeacuta]
MDILYMREALREAKKAYSTYEVPVGAIVVYNGEIIGRGYNQREILKDPTAHAEILAIKEASKYIEAWRLLNCTMYVTLEPCAMCAGAIVNARIGRLVIGTRDPKRGCCGTIEDLTNHPKFNHRLEVEFGVLEDECSSILSDFFRELRESK